ENNQWPAGQRVMRRYRASTGAVIRSLRLRIRRRRVSARRRVGSSTLPRSGGGATVVLRGAIAGRTQLLGVEVIDADGVDRHLAQLFQLLAFVGRDPALAY